MPEEPAPAAATGVAIHEDGAADQEMESCSCTAQAQAISEFEQAVVEEGQQMYLIAAE